MVCAAAERLFATGANFDPAESEREFTPAHGRLHHRRPGRAAVRRSLERGPARDAARPAGAGGAGRGRRRHDPADRRDGRAAGRAGFGCPASGRPNCSRDRWVCVVSAGEPAAATAASSAWTISPGCLGGAVLAGPPGTRRRRPGAAAAGAARHPAAASRVRVESYQAVPHFVAGTDRVALLQERLAHGSPTGSACGSWRAPVSRSRSSNAVVARGPRRDLGAQLAAESHRPGGSRPRSALTHAALAQRRTAAELGRHSGAVIT